MAEPRWLAFELNREYVGASAFRFIDRRISNPEMRAIFERIEAGQTVNMDEYQIQPSLLLDAIAK